MMIGDRKSDMQAADAAGVGKLYWLSKEVVTLEGLEVTARLDNLAQLENFL